NQKIREIVRGRFPKDGWLSEEDKDSSHRLSLSRVWVIDPIDGTKEFIEGVPQFAVSIGFVFDGRPKVAVVYNLSEDSFYKRAAGQSASAAADSSCSTGRTSGTGASLPPTPHWPRDYSVCGRKRWRRKSDASS